MKPLFEGEPIEKSLKIVQDNLGNARGSMYSVDGDKPYTDLLEFAVGVKNSEVREKLVTAARELRYERAMKAEAYRQLDDVHKQLGFLISENTGKKLG